MRPEAARVILAPLLFDGGAYRRDLLQMMSRISSPQGIRIFVVAKRESLRLKTAGLVAADLGRTLLPVEPEELLSRYIGETEKHLVELHANAEALGAIPFMDAADALYGRSPQSGGGSPLLGEGNGVPDPSYLRRRLMESPRGVVLAVRDLDAIDPIWLRQADRLIQATTPALVRRRVLSWLGLRRPPRRG